MIKNIAVAAFGIALLAFTTEIAAVAQERPQKGQKAKSSPELEAPPVPANLNKTAQPRKKYPAAKTAAEDHLMPPPSEKPRETGR